MTAIGSPVPSAPMTFWTAVAAAAGVLISGATNPLSQQLGGEWITRERIDDVDQVLQRLGQDVLKHGQQVERGRPTASGSWISAFTAPATLPAASWLTAVASTAGT